MAALTNRQVVQELIHLYRICLAGEKIFQAVAVSLSNRGLKLLLITFADQRVLTSNELKREIRRLGGNVSQRDSLRSIIHRGRIYFKVALTIGKRNVENSVLSEALSSEQSATRTFKRVLAKPLPIATRLLIERHYDQILATQEQIEQLKGHHGKRVVVQLFDSVEEVETALAELEREGFTPSYIEKREVKIKSPANREKGVLVQEMMFSGAADGAIGGSIIGAFAGLGVMMISEVHQTIGASLEFTWVVIALFGALAGTLIGLLLRCMIGIVIPTEDVYACTESRMGRAMLVKLFAEDDQAERVAQIMWIEQMIARVRTMASSEQTQG